MNRSKKVLVVLFALVMLVIIGLLLFRFVLLPVEFRPQANPVPDCQSSIFDKSAIVFDTLLICGTNEVPDDKLSHAANVAAEWLDNDEDGQVDEPRLLEVMASNKPVVIMSGKGISIAAMPGIMVALNGYQTQDLSASETNPAGSRRDASQEEIHHIIMNAGWQHLSPAIFSESESANSVLFRAWKFADNNAYYVYDDPTCDASCKVTEFVYLATAAYLGSDIDLESDEMRLKTRDALAETIPAMIEIFESTDYVYPSNHWPDGKYPHSHQIVFTGISE